MVTRGTIIHFFQKQKTRIKPFKIVPHYNVIQGCASINFYNQEHTMIYDILNITFLLVINSYNFLADFVILYSGKVWRGESLANLANHLWFAKLKPSNFYSQL